MSPGASVQPCLAAHAMLAANVASPYVLSIPSQSAATACANEDEPWSAAIPAISGRQTVAKTNSPGTR